MQDEPIPPRLAPLTIEAIGHGRKLALDALGAPALLICVARGTSDAAPRVVDAVRAKYPLATQVLIATMVDLRHVPRLVRRVARSMMMSSYREAVARLEPGAVPEEQVLILPDWAGDVMRSLSLTDVSSTVAVAGIDAAGGIVGVYQGFDVATRALALVELARSASPR